MSRPSWSEYFIALARDASTRSTCLRRKVGAVLVKDWRILATGYNGAPAGLPHCSELGCRREGLPSGEALDKCRATHAEENAVAMAARHGISVDGSTLYCTHSPCPHCAGILINAGVREIVYAEPYPLQEGLDVFEKAGVKVKMWKDVF